MNSAKIYSPFFMVMFVVFTFNIIFPMQAFSATIAEYTFNDGTANDMSGNGNHATVNGSTLTSDRFGSPNQAMYFDGTNDYIQTPVNGNQNPIAFSAWFRADTLGGEQSIIDSDVAGNYGHSLIIDYALASPNTNNLDLQYHNGATDTGDDGKITLANWHHTVVCYGANIEVYLDNVLVHTQPYSPPALDGTTFRLGRHNASDPQWFNGAIDDVRFFDACLSPEEVEQLFLEGLTTTNIPTLSTTGIAIFAGLLGLTAMYAVRMKKSGVRYL